MTKSDKILKEIYAPSETQPKSEVPGMIKFMSFIAYLISAFFFVIGVTVISIGILISRGLSSLEITNVLNQISNVVSKTVTDLPFMIKDFPIYSGIALIVISAIILIPFLSLSRGRNWARWLIIIISLGLAIFSLTTIILLKEYTNLLYIIVLLLSILVSLYLIINKKVREAF
jgi:hypothetical protein